MSAISKELADTEIEELGMRKPWGAVLMHTIRRKPLGAAGGLIVLIMITLAVLADVITPYDPVVNAFDKMHLPPSAEFWLGTDQFGREIGRAHV